LIITAVKLEILDLKRADNQEDRNSGKPARPVGLLMSPDTQNILV
jgi:hypothetical protein